VCVCVCVCVVVVVVVSVIIVAVLSGCHEGKYLKERRRYPGLSKVDH
jgi:hypothetical protein